MSASLFDRIGGKPAVNAAVDLFYKKVLADPRINNHFENVDMPRQIGHQKAFLSYAFGGLEGYSGKSLREGHKHMNLTEADFQAVAENLHETLIELGLPSELISEVMTIAASTHDDVLNL